MIIKLFWHGSLCAIKWVLTNKNNEEQFIELFQTTLLKVLLVDSTHLSQVSTRRILQIIQLIQSSQVTATIRPHQSNFSLTNDNSSSSSP
mmetsp:Transcript_22665/g.49064  ORF Transcript_22665/g.49064 Transcript_22665/m.49064 type:complete len:90 (+) Transcript_22665:21-290(+)